MKENNSDLHKVIQRQFQELLELAGSQTELARLSGVDQGRIAKMVSGKIKFNNITVETIERLFPNAILLNYGRPNENVAMIKRLQRIIAKMNSEELAELLVWLASRYPHNTK